MNEYFINNNKQNNNFQLEKYVHNLQKYLK